MQKPPLNPELLSGTRVKIVGLGGVGSISSRYLSIFLAAQSKPCGLILIDADSYEPKNASRMLFSDYGNKAEVVRSDLLRYYQDSQMSIIAVPKYITTENAHEMIGDGDIVILCVDNHQTRRLVNEHCKTLNNVVLINGGNMGVGKDSGGREQRGTFGNVQIYIRKNGKDVSDDICRMHPEIASPKDKHPDQISCTDAIMSTPQILFANLAVASAICNAFFLYLCAQLHYEECCFDIAEAKMVPVLPIPNRGD